MPWKTLCKHRTALPWRLWSIISSSSVIYIPAPLCCGKREGKPFFVFHLIVDRLTLWPVLLVSVRKRIFSPSYLKMKFQGESKGSFSSFHSKQCLHSKRGKMKSKSNAFSSAGEGRCSFWKRIVQPLQISFSETFDGVFQNAVKAFGAGFCGAPLWVAAAGTDQESRPLLLEAWEEDGSKLLGGCLLEDCFQQLSFFWKWRPLFHQRETWESSFCKRRKGQGWILHIYGSWEQNWSLDPEFEVASSWWYRTR